MTTTYVVLREEGDGETKCWYPYGLVRSRDALTAVRQAAGDKKPGSPVVLVAIPERNFRPVRVTPRQETTLDVTPVKKEAS